MSDIDQLRKILCEAAYDSTNSAIPLLIQIIDDALGNGKRRYDVSKQTRDQSSELTSLLTRLANREIQSNNTLLSFGSGNQLGDITIRDIISGSKFTINIVLELDKPKVQKIEEKRVFGCLNVSILSISTSRIITTLILIIAITMISIFIRQIIKNPLLPIRPTSLAIEPTIAILHQS
ncbi:hypothetical protein [Candidatus Oscillochloris fontis]|uniref:hypothetical protein n=1 Tax=Candidatus Oscillochloris fontis TaxID=2496868 RepID=UPI00101D7522|nr:hypothetical protein [Candidatus Oscillochloris fontis]